MNSCQYKTSRRNFITGSSLAFAAALTPGCLSSDNTTITGTADLVWGRFGFSEGQFKKPRAITINDKDEIFVVDMTGRIQVFNAEGKFLRHWSTPECKNGRPTGLSIGPDGNVWVADTHYFQALCYTPDGKMLKEKSIFSGPGIEPGRFGMLTEVAHDKEGRIYIGEYGENDRVQVFAPDGPPNDRKVITQIGSHGTDAGQFLRPQALAVDEDGLLWVADSGNHRFQVFSLHKNKPKLEFIIGSSGKEPGQLFFPYDFFFDQDGSIWVCEFGNSRVQKISKKGDPIYVWKSKKRGRGGVYQPWGMVKDSKNRLHVLDSYHHRVFRVSIS